MSRTYATTAKSSSPSTINPYVTVTFSSTLTVAGSADLNYRCSLTGDVTIATPTSPADGAEVKFWLTASGGARNITFAGGIVVPTSSSFTSPFNLASGKKAKAMLQYDSVLNGGQWELTSFIPGY